MTLLNGSLITKNISLGNLTNTTSLYSVVNGPEWSFVPIFYVIVTTIALITNGSVMVAFLCCKSLRTPFNIYLTNLVTANFIYAILQNPADIINNLYTGWWLGSGYCSLYIYGLYIFEAGIRTCHLLITLNRLWAVLWPHSYRRFHKKQTACLVCLGGWAYVHITVLPGFILDAMYYRHPLVVNPCSLNAAAQWKWALGIQIVVYNLVSVIMMAAYPVIWYKRHKRQPRINPTSVATLPSGTRHSSRNTKGTVGESTEDQTKGVGEAPVAAVAVAVVADQNEMEKMDEEVMAKAPKNSKTHRKRSSNAFRILTVLTISVAICWTPMCCYYTITVWIPMNNQLLMQFSIVLFAMQSLLDPILFVFALPDLRQIFRQMFFALKSVCKC